MQFDWYSLLGLALLVNLWIASTFFVQRGSSRIHRTFFDFVLLILLWTATDYLQVYEMSLSSRITLLKIGALGWLGLGALFIAFVNAVLGRPQEHLYHSTFLIAIIAITITLGSDLVVAGATHNQQGWTHSPGPLFSAITLASVVVPMVVGLIIILNAYGRAQDPLRKQQLLILAISIGAALALGTLTDLILPDIFGDRRFVNTAGIVATLQALFISNLVISHRSVALRFEDTAQNLFEKSSDGCIIVNPSGFAVKLNSAAKQMLNAQNIPEGGRPLSQIISQKNFEFATEGEQEIELFSSHTNTKVNLMVTQIKSQHHNQELGWILLIKNISAQKIALLKLERAKEDIEKSSQIKSEFLARMNHEMRTPMSAILGMHHLLLEAPLSKQSRRYATQAQNSAHMLLAVIDDLLDFTDLSNRELIVVRARFDPNKMFYQLENWTTTKQGTSPVAMLFEFPDKPPPVLLGDSYRILQILHHLIGNAIKFTHRGSIIVKVKEIKHAANTTSSDGLSLRFSVQDTGIGISATKLEQLFELFAQGDEGTDRTYEGMGLGLTLCHDLLHQMGTVLEVASTPQKGSEFSFELWFDFPNQLESVSGWGKEQTQGLIFQSDDNEPTATSDKLTAAKPKQTINPTVERERKASSNEIVASGRHILLVEDNPINQLVTKRLLEKRDFIVSVADNGVLALAQLNDHGEHNQGRFDVVLMDIRMPKMDGFEATKRIREGNSVTANIPIIALTADDVLETRNRCFAVGMNSYLSKPVKAEQLIAELERWL